MSNTISVVHIAHNMYMLNDIMCRCCFPITLTGSALNGKYLPPTAAFFLFKCIFLGLHYLFLCVVVVVVVLEVVALTKLFPLSE